MHEPCPIKQGLQLTMDKPLAAIFAARLLPFCRLGDAQSCRMNMLTTLHRTWPCFRALSAILATAARTVLFATLMHAGAAFSGEELRDTVFTYARTQTQGLPGEVSIQVGQLDPGTLLPPCTSLQAYTPNGSRLWGKTFVGVRCLGPANWNVLVPVSISAIGNYIVTSRALSAGQALQPSDFTSLRGDLTTLPAGVVTDVTAVIGKTLKNGLGSGQPLRQELLLAPFLVKQGQTVRILSRGTGFTATGEGRAINNAAEGQVAQVRVPSGQTISGVVQPDGSVEISR